MGGALLADTITKWLSGDITPKEQNHEAATYCHKLSKADSELNIDPYNLPTEDEARAALRQIRAFAGIGDTFFKHKDKRIKVKQASLDDNDTLIIKSVIPEGKKEMSFTDYLNQHGAE